MVKKSEADMATGETPQAKAKAAARKAAQAAAIAETYTAGGGITPAETVEAAPSELEELKMRELVQAAVEAADLKKPAAKAAIETALGVMGKALADGRDVNLPGLGKVKIKRSKVTNGRRVSELRLRQNIEVADSDDDGDERVAEDNEAR